MTNNELAMMKVGHQVVLNSGGPMMTVAGWQDDSLSIEALNNAPRNDRAVLRDVEAEDVSVNVAWCDNHGQLQSAALPAACLRLSRGTADAGVVIHTKGAGGIDHHSV